MSPLNGIRLLRCWMDTAARGQLHGPSGGLQFRCSDVASLRDFLQTSWQLLPVEFFGFELE